MRSSSAGRSALVSALGALLVSACVSGGSEDAPGTGGTATGGRGSAGSGGSTGGTGGKSGAVGGSAGKGSGGSTGKGSGGSAGASTGCNGDPAPNPNGTANLFSALLCKTQAEVDAKVTTAVSRFFGIGTGEPATPAVDTGYRCYYELPQDPSMAFIWAADSNDVRSEGMSYGMLIAVQMDLHTEFDKLWKFAKTYMQFPANTGTTPFKYYFHWRGTVAHGSGNDWSVSFGATEIPAPDGDEYFAAALYLADARWGSGGAVNYKQEADNVSAAMLHNGAANSRFPIIHSSQNMVVFVPYGSSNDFTDPSYHLPGFYELFAARGPSGDAAKWRTVASTSRGFLQRSAHATTGLHPDYARFGGQPTTAQGGDGHDEFKYDAWRVVMNMAIDYAWYSQDATMKAQIEKYHAFFSTRLAASNVTNSLFRVDGSNESGGGSTALTATLAAGSLASNHALRETYVQNLWNVAQQSGTYRYYQETLYLMGLLAVAGKYNHTF